MVTLLGARIATKTLIESGMRRTKNSTMQNQSHGLRTTQTKLGQYVKNTTRTTRGNEVHSTQNGQRTIRTSGELVLRRGRPSNLRQRQHGQIKMQSRVSTLKRCASKKKPEYESTLIISSRYKARSFAACTLNRICKYSTGRRTRANAISDGLTCHERIEMAQAQATLFEPQQPAEQHAFAL